MSIITFQINSNFLILINENNFSIAGDICFRFFYNFFFADKRQTETYLTLLDNTTIERNATNAHIIVRFRTGDY